MVKILNLGDFFMFSLEDLKKINQNKQDNDRIDHENIEHAIRFFYQNNVAFFRADVVLSEDDNVSFKQTFLDENKSEISVLGMFGNEFLLHLHECCPMVESYNEPSLLSLDTPILINDLNFYDADLYCIPLSAFQHYDLSLFTKKFNHAVLGARKKELTHLVFQINYPDLERKSAGDDLTNLFRKDPFKFDYSIFNFTQNPFIRLFFTNKFGECHFNLNNVSEVKKENDNDSLANNAFYSEAPNKQYMGGGLDFISTLTPISLHRLLQIDSVRKSIEQIGNFRSDEYNYISTYDARNLFKQHQINKMIHLNEIKAVFIDRNDLPKEYHSTLLPETTHLVFLPIDHQEKPQFKQIFMVEAVSIDGVYHYNEIKKEISISAFNHTIGKSKNIQVIKKSEDELKNTEIFFPFGKYREIEISDERSGIAYGINFGNAYTIPLVSIKHSINKNSSTYKEIEDLESLGVSNCIVHASFPYQFLLSDDEMVINDRIYFERERQLELRVYPLKKDTFEFLDLDEENYQLHKDEDNIYKKLISAPNIKLNTGDTLNVLKEHHSEMHLIEERKNPFFRLSSVLTRHMLRMYNEMLLEEKKLSEENKTSKKTPTLKF